MTIMISNVTKNISRAKCFQIQDVQQLITPWAQLMPCFVPLGKKNRFPTVDKNVMKEMQMSDCHEQDLSPCHPFQLYTLYL